MVGGFNYLFLFESAKCCIVAESAADTNTAVKVNPDKIITIDNAFVDSRSGYRSPYPTVKNEITTKYKASPQDLIVRL